MAKDYFQDIVPPEDGNRPPQKPKKLNITSSVPDDEDEVEVPEEATPAPPMRSIRDIAPSKTRLRMSGDREFINPPQTVASSGSSRFRVPSKMGLWIAAGVGILVVFVLGLFAFRDSSVIVTPRTQAVTFDEAMRFTAYPEGSAAEGALAYKIMTADLEDSEPVAAQGTQHAETKASGSIKVYNNYSTSPTRLIKNTRFESADGHIFRTPTDVVVPGKKGSTPGSINVTVVADKAGDGYNVAPGKFTVPGLKGNDAMYTGVYAQSDSAFTGGFIGDQPAVAPATLTAAVSAVRARLQSKAAESLQAQDGYRMFPDMMQISYQTLPSTTEAGGGVRIHEKAHIQVVALPTDAFAQAVAKSVTADAQNSSVTLNPGAGFAAHSNTAVGDWGTKPIDFTLAGAATIVWNVDPSALASALAGKDESAFQTIITGYPGIQEAHARIQPFWKSTFPKAEKINVQVTEPAVSQ